MSKNALSPFQLYAKIGQNNAFCRHTKIIAHQDKISRLRNNYNDKIMTLWFAIIYGFLNNIKHLIQAINAKL